jgi:hypothetical protein
LIKVGIAAVVSLMAAIGLGVAALPANAGCQGTPHQFCSRTFNAMMACDDPRGLASIRDNHCPQGQSCPECPTGRHCPLIQPWEPAPIRILGVELALTHGRFIWAFAGNAHVPDVMVTMGGGQTRVQQWFRVGQSFSMPPAGTPGHIDLHIACEMGWLGRRRWVHFYYTIYYTTAD